MFNDDALCSGLTGTNSSRTGEASRIAASFDADATGAVLPLRGFFARSFVGYTQKENGHTSAPIAAAQETQAEGV